MFNTDEFISVSLNTLIALAQPAKSVELGFLQGRSAYQGGYCSRLKSRGMEFDEARLYQAGDDVRNIDWRVTARTGKVHTKLFREERDRPVFISVDYRPSMHFATRGVFKSVFAAQLASLLAWSAHHHSDRVGGQVFTAQQCHELKPQTGQSAVLHWLNLLVRYHTLETVTTSALSLEPVLTRLSHHAHAGSLIYLLSDFRGLSEQAEHQLIKLTQHCTVVLVFIADPLERGLPKAGRYRFTNGERDVILNSEQQHGYQQRFQQRQQALMRLARFKGMALVQCQTTDTPLDCLR